MAAAQWNKGEADRRRGGGGCCCGCCRCAHRCSDRYPRAVAIGGGILAPLFSLVAIAVVFGYWLAREESPLEIVGNNAVVAATAVLDFRNRVLANATAVTPLVCLRLFAARDNRTGVDVGQFWTATVPGAAANATLLDTIDTSVTVNFTVASFLAENDDPFSAPLTAPQAQVNTTELYRFMSECGERARETLQRFVQLTTLETAMGALTFSWNRCAPVNASVGDGYSFANEESAYTYSLRPAQQEQYFTDTWMANQTELYKQYYDVYRNEQNHSIPEATAMALNQSVSEATGAAACTVNTYAGAWFWFTIMTTIGYGDQIVETANGRVMVFTIGFLSILAFGGILVTAGFVVTTIFDDALVRFRLRRLTVPWVACFFWGSLYYGWMCGIAQVYKTWERQRLGVESETSFRDAYWFAYISTTTVGLGDFVLAPEVLRQSDLITWPFLFLVGFVLFAVFIGKLAQLVPSPFVGHSISLADRLKELGMVYGESRHSEDDPPDFDEIEPSGIAETDEPKGSVSVKASSLANGSMVLGESAMSDFAVVSLEGGQPSSN